MVATESASIAPQPLDASLPGSHCPAVMMTMHGTSVLISGTGVLLRGPSGAGKSDLALRLIDRGAVLVADDRVEMRMERRAVMMSAPTVLAGLLEVRGVGILRFPFAPVAELHLVVDLVKPEVVDRLPEPEWITILDQRLPRLTLAPFEASAPVKLGLAAHAAREGRLGLVPGYA